MKKFSLGLLIAVLLVTSFSLAYTIFAKEQKGAPEFVPQLGEKDLKKVVFIRYAPDYHKAKACNYDNICDANENPSCADCKNTGGDDPSPVSTCYDFLSGAKPRWQLSENYIYDDSTLGASSADAVAILESVTSGDIFGSGSSGSGIWGVYDHKNLVTYGNYAEEGVLGVTAIWFKGKNIYEYDIMLDNDFFPTGSYDLDTVIFHEFGHAAGLGDLYDSTCVGELMYYQLDAGEVKSELGNGDITGIQTLYGN